MPSPRVRRLLLDHETLTSRLEAWPLIQITGTAGMPPEIYRFTYNIRGLYVSREGEILERSVHVLEVNLSLGYPRRAPQCRMLTPVFHPNFDDSMVCIGDFWAASEGLDDLIIRIGRMISYQEYNTKSPLNGLAAKWAAQNANLLPIDSRNIAPPLKGENAAAGDPSAENISSPAIAKMTRAASRPRSYRRRRFQSLPQRASRRRANRKPTLGRKKFQSNDFVTVTGAAALAAVHGGMADVLALDDVDNVFGDVGGVVANAFEIFGHEDQFERGKNHAGIAHHVGKQFAKDLIAVVIDLIVHGENFLGELDVAADDGVQRVANHFFGDFAHAREINVRFYARVAKDADAGLRDVDGLIADALEIVVDARNSEDEAEVGGHQLMQREHLDDAVVDFELKLVDLVFFVENALGELFIGVENGMDGLVDGALGERAHPEEPFFDDVEIFFEVAFHLFL